MKTHMIHCNSEFRAYALIILRTLKNLPDECVSTKLRVAVNHVCFHLVTQFYTYLYIFILPYGSLNLKLAALSVHNVLYLYF